MPYCIFVSVVSYTDPSGYAV